MNPVNKTYLIAVMKKQVFETYRDKFGGVILIFKKTDKKEREEPPYDLRRVYDPLHNKIKYYWIEDLKYLYHWTPKMEEK